MIKLTVLGSCSGTEPMPGRHHTAFTLTLDSGRVLWFDAGEGCAFSGYMNGIDLLSVSDIFISHPHIDHVGGLIGLLGMMRKLTCLPAKVAPPRRHRYGKVRIWMPSEKTWHGVMEILGMTESNCRCRYDTLMTRIHDGVLWDDGEVKISCVRNRHIPETSEGPVSFSYRVETDSQRIVYSGDIKSFDDLLPLLDDGCDLLLIETGHHVPSELARRAAGFVPKIGSILYIHHGRTILYHYSDQLQNVRSVFGTQAYFADDGASYKLSEGIFAPL